MKVAILILGITLLLGCKKEKTEKVIEPTYCFHSKFFIPKDSVLGDGVNIAGIKQVGFNKYIGKVTCPDTMHYVYRGIVAYITTNPWKIRVDSVYVLTKDTLSILTTTEVINFVFTRESLKQALN